MEYENKQETGQASQTELAPAETDETGQPPVSEPAMPKFQKGAKERFYDKIPLSVGQLNVIIAALVIAIVAFLVVGTLVGKGLIG